MRDDSPPPDRVTRTVRFVCGGLLGLFLGFFLAGEVAISTIFELLGTLGASAIICGALATCYGDRFWYSLRHLDLFWP